MPKILRDTPEGTVIEDRPWFLGLVLVGFCLIAVYMALVGLAERDLFMIAAGTAFAIGLVFVLRLAIRHARLVLHPDGGATLTIRDATGLQERPIAQGALRAGLATDYSEGETHRVILLIDTPEGLERLPFTRYLGGSGSHALVVERINSWAKAHRA